MKFIESYPLITDLWGLKDIQRLEKHHGSWKALLMVIRNNLGHIYYRIFFKYWRARKGSSNYYARTHKFFFREKPRFSIKI